jgi:hypothetical protein
MSTDQHSVKAAGLLVGHVLATGQTVTRVEMYTAYGLHGGTWIEWTTDDGAKDSAPAYSLVHTAS